MSGQVAKSYSRVAKSKLSHNGVYSRCDFGNVRVATADISRLLAKVLTLQPTWAKNERKIELLRPSSRLRGRYPEWF
jgi:hypothetical protein